MRELWQQITEQVPFLKSKSEGARREVYTHVGVKIHVYHVGDRRPEMIAQYRALPAIASIRESIEFAEDPDLTHASVTYVDPSPQDKFTEDCERYICVTVVGRGIQKAELLSSKAHISPDAVYESGRKHLFMDWMENKLYGLSRIIKPDTASIVVSGGSVSDSEDEGFYRELISGVRKPASEIFGLPIFTVPPHVTFLARTHIYTSANTIHILQEGKWPRRAHPFYAHELEGVMRQWNLFSSKS